MNRIIDRVRKMLAVSKSDNEHEAALAAQRAADLMAEYNLTEAMLRVEDNTRQAEAIVKDLPYEVQPKKRKRVAWMEMIGSGVAKSLGCHMYLEHGGMYVFGREGATQAWRYTTQYLIREVNRLAANQDGDRKWKNAFRIGAAQSIMNRLNESVKPRPPENTHDKALMIVERDQDEVNASYADLSKNFGRAAVIGRVTISSAYQIGKEAGESVSLGGGRAALKAGQGRLQEQNPGSRG